MNSGMVVNRITINVIIGISAVVVVYAFSGKLLLYIDTTCPLKREPAELPPSAPLPVVASWTPASADDGGSPRVTVTGTNFSSDTTVKLTRSDQPDMAGTNVNVASGQQLRCTFNLIGAAVGMWDLVVTTDDATVRLPKAFAVTAALNPTLAGFTPGTPQQNCGNIPCGVFGSNLQAGAMIRAVRSGTPDIPAANYNYQNTGCIGFTMNFGGARPGVYTIVLTNPNNGQAALGGALVIVPTAKSPYEFSLGEDESTDVGSGVRLTLIDDNSKKRQAAEVAITAPNNEPRKRFLRVNERLILESVSITLLEFNLPNGRARFRVDHAG